MGDMACHIMDMPYWALDLGSPQSVEAESHGATKETGPLWSTITYQFAARDAVGGGQRGAAIGPKAAVSQPAVKYVWYDGKKDDRPNAPYDLLARATEEVRSGKVAAPPGETKPGKPPPPVDDPGRWDLILVGDAGLMLFARKSTREDEVNLIVTPDARTEQFTDIPKTIARTADHDMEWIEACKGNGKPLSNFDYAGPFTETVLLGTLAVRLGKKFTWNSAELKAINTPEADAFIRREYRTGWQLSEPVRAS
jgi:hypothetical protein